MHLNDVLVQARQNDIDLTESGNYIVNYGNSVDGFLFVGLNYKITDIANIIRRNKFENNTH